MVISVWPTVLALFAIAAWSYLLLARRGFWLARPRFEREPKAPEPIAWPAVVAIVPARDEELTIARSLTSLLQQTYPGPLRIVLVDDHSQDATRAIAVRLAADADGRLDVVAARDLPGGWSGKLWAQNEGLARAASIAPDASWVLLSDADIAHAPANLARLVAKAEADALDLVSLMVRLRCETAAERLLIPPFVFFFQMLYPFATVNDRLSSTAAAAGGCILLRRSAFEAAGGLVPIRDRLIDDVALARQIKSLGGGIWLGLSETTLSLRAYEDIAPIWRMVRRTADEELEHSLVRLAGVVLGMMLVYLGPVVALLSWPWHGEPAAALLGALAWAMMVLAYAPTARLYGLSPWWWPTLPLAAALFTLMTIDSALQHRRGRGGGWKGRHFGPPALTRGGD